MKTITLSLSLLLVINLSSCKKDEVPPMEYMNFKFNGNLFKCEYVSYFSTATNSEEIPDLTISGRKGQANVTLRIIPESGKVTPGTYEFKPGNRSGSIYVTPPITILGLTVSWEYLGGSNFDQTAFYGPGHITITHINESFIKGTFSFTGINPGATLEGEFTEGEFSLRRY
jgi:hypothetical protein